MAARVKVGADAVQSRRKRARAVGWRLVVACWRTRAVGSGCPEMEGAVQLRAGGERRYVLGGDGRAPLR